MAISGSTTSKSIQAAPGEGNSYGSALAMVTTLFFMWDFLTSLNDILIPHLKSIFQLNYAQVMLVQFAFSRRMRCWGFRRAKWWSGSATRRRWWLGC